MYKRQTRNKNKEEREKVRRQESGNEYGKKNWEEKEMEE